jgi:hypothetical protein
MKMAPIVFFAFNRPEHTRRVLESLKNNKESESSELYVFIDGPRNEKEAEAIKNIVDIIKSKKWCHKIELTQRSDNRGCAKQVLDIVTRFCSDKGRIIVLEDDNLLSPFFLNFINTALERYQDEEKVSNVTGYMYPIRKLNMEAAFMRGGGGWGWGTWQRAWKDFEIDGNKLLKQIEEKSAEYEFNFHGAEDYVQLLKDHIQGKFGGWDIRWYATNFLKGRLTLYPTQSLVQNIGFDGTGAQTPNTRVYETKILNRAITEYPEIIEESDEMLKATIQYYNSQPRFIAKKLLRNFKNIFKR